MQQDPKGNPTRLASDGSALTETTVAPITVRCHREAGAHGSAMCKQDAGNRTNALPCVTEDQPSGGAEGRSSSPVPPPSFLVQNKDNVNAQLYRAKGLITFWDFLLYKGRVGSTVVVLQNKEDTSQLKLMPATCQSRYFEDGRLKISRSIKKRLAKYENVKGLMETLTYDPKKVTKQEAWSSFSKDTRKFLNGINQYRKRRGWQRLHYLWVVEVQKETGYPHVHIFFPNLKWLAPLAIINGNWNSGRANIESPKSIKTNCAGYISKYLRKMNGWNDLHLALLWSGRCRMYGFSRSFSVKEEKNEAEWQKWAVLYPKDKDLLEKSLEEGGFKIDRRFVNTKG
ncbi:hypothetical protein CY91_01160 [Dehalococcoides mccartyi]|uniref:rolling circle replication-associated protein n=1 Tax=Dehalococcoides mccartyi TaxID=61435 RepID=UPI00073C950D|nr:hypothetical protein [Dehalococcoides mccartyi]KSV17380.1 hypothetical protein CY91_01160 [Dehalococcoides mccartyi]